jgi:hypothetical protein
MTTYYFGNSLTGFLGKKQKTKNSCNQLNWKNFTAHHSLPQGELTGRGT